MEPRDAARALAFGRIAIGAALVAAPRTAAAGWIGRDGRRPATTVVTRALGARDALLGFMVLHTIDRSAVGASSPEASRPVDVDVAVRWLAATATVDAVDCVAALAVRDELPRVRGLAGIAVAGGAAATGFALSRALGAGRGDTPPAG